VLLAEWVGKPAARLEVVQMRRLVVVVVVLVLACTLWSAMHALAQGSPAASVTAAGSLRADFNNDGFADLAVGVPAEDVGGIIDAGAVNVLYGSAAGLTGAGSQLFTQDTPGVASSAETGDQFGFALAAGDFNHDGAADLAIGMIFESVGSNAEAGGVNVLYGSAAGLTGVGSQFLTQNTPGVPDFVEELTSWALYWPLVTITTTAPPTWPWVSGSRTLAAFVTRGRSTCCTARPLG
jgi:hypothetical protein